MLFTPLKSWKPALDWESCCNGSISEESVLQLYSENIAVYCKEGARSDAIIVKKCYVYV